MTQTNNEREAFAIADKVIKEAYQDFNNKGNGWWGDERIPNYGILRGAIAKAICEEQSKISQNEQQPKLIPDGWNPISEEQIEFIALQDKFWKGTFNNDKIDWMMFAKEIENKLRELNAAPTHTE